MTLRSRLRSSRRPKAGCCPKPAFQDATATLSIRLPVLRGANGNPSPSGLWLGAVAPPLARLRMLRVAVGARGSGCRLRAIMRPPPPRAHRLVTPVPFAIPTSSGSLTGNARPATSPVPPEGRPPPPTPPSTPLQLPIAPLRRRTFWVRRNVDFARTGWPPAFRRQLVTFRASSRTPTAVPSPTPRGGPLRSPVSSDACSNDSAHHWNAQTLPSGHFPSHPVIRNDSDTPSLCQHQLPVPIHNLTPCDPQPAPTSRNATARSSMGAARRCRQSIEDSPAKRGKSADSPPRGLPATRFFAPLIKTSHSPTPRARDKNLALQKKKKN